MSEVPAFDRASWKPTHELDGPQPLEVRALYRFEADAGWGVEERVAVQGETGRVWFVELSKLSPLPLSPADVGLQESYWASATRNFIGHVRCVRADAEIDAKIDAKACRRPYVVRLEVKDVTAL